MARRPPVRMLLAVLLLGAGLVACSADDSGERSAPATTTTAAPSSTAPAATAPAGAGCGTPGASTTPEGPSATTQALSDTVEAVVYPRPDVSEDGLWSQWGQGIVLPDGRLLSAAGDHLGQDGNSWFFVYDPATSTLTRFADAQQLLDHVPGDWGYGKIHA